MRIRLFWDLTFFACHEYFHLDVLPKDEQMGVKKKKMQDVLNCKMEKDGKRLSCFNCPYYKGQEEENGKVIILCDSDNSK